jgi:FMN phosphatase YigB (HAD superfamily)
MIDAVIFDMDGTLCNTSHLLYLLEDEPRDFHRYHVESVYAPAHEHVVRDAIWAYQMGWKILIVTARIATYHPETVAWLGNNLPVPVERIYMRRDGDLRPDGEIKREILDFIESDGYDVLHAWDDNPQVIEVWESEGIPVTAIEGLYK